MSSVLPHIRRSPLSMVAGVVLVIAGSLVSAGIYSQLSYTQEVIAVVSPVARGQQIQRSDLTVVHVGRDPILTPIDGSQLNAIVGKYAAADLVAGSFLVQEAVGDQPCPGRGEAAIGVALMAGEYPDEQLLPGDQILLVAIPDFLDPEVQPRSVPGTLSSISTGQGNSMSIFTVIVSVQDAPRLAVLSASNRLALVLVTREI